MAAIARFISFDGGIAFSENTLKIQKRSQAQGQLIPISEIAAMDVDEPLFGDDGRICLRLVREKRISEANALYFDEEQYEEAVRFKVAFDTMKSRASQVLPPLEMFPPPAPARAQIAPRALRPVGEARRQPVRQPEMRPVRRERPPVRRKGKLKRVLIGMLGVYAALLAVGGLALLFGNERTDDLAATGTPAAVSETWQQPVSATAVPQPSATPVPQASATPAPDPGVFLEQAKAAASGQTAGGTQIKSVSLSGRDLQISVDYADPAYLDEYDDSVLLADSDRIVGPILALGEQYDVLWDSMTVDYGSYGKVVRNKSDVASQQDASGGAYSQRYFAPAAGMVVHDVPLPEKQSSSASGSGSVETYGVIAAGEAVGAGRTAGNTSPPAATDPPVTAPPAQRTEALVWIPTKGGTKYHRTSTCSGMNGPIQVTVSEAVNMGFTPCKKCY